MNLYFLVEGRRTEKRVYRSWIVHVFPDLRRVDCIEDIEENTFFIISGNGYPSISARIEDSLRDIERHGNIDHFFVCVDAEEDDPDVKLARIEDIVIQGPTVSSYFVIIQNCCIETWFLGNRRIMRRNPQSSILRNWKEFYDVALNDPEKMECPPEYEFKVHFHEDYLKEMFRERGISYSKTRPGAVVQKYYVDELVTRYEQTGHLCSFGRLLQAWRLLGGRI